MAKKEELFLIIKSLSRSEKRNFKLESAHFRSPPNYVRLFDAIDKLETYDEEIVRKIFEGQKLNDQFHVIKHYLKQALLKSLRDFHGARSKAVELRNCISNIELLFNKELYRICEVEIKKAERIALNFQLYPGLVELLSWKRRLAQTRAPSNFESFREIIGHQEDTLEKLKNQQDYNRLILEISESIYQRKEDPVSNEELLEDPSNAKTFESGVMHYNSLYFRSIQSGRENEAPTFLRDLEAYFELNSALLPSYPGLYLSSMNNAISYFVFNQAYEEALRMVTKVKAFYRQIKVKNENLTMLKQILRTRLIELDIYRSADLVEEYESEIREIMELVGKSEKKMPEDYLQSFWFQFANIEFFKKDFSSALNWLNLFLNHKFGSTRPDIQLHARMLNLMVHFEQQNIVVLRYFVDSTRRFAQKNGMYEGFIERILKLFSQLGKAPVLEYKQIFREFSAGLDGIEEEIAFGNNKTSYVNYERWLASKEE